MEEHATQQDDFTNPPSCHFELLELLNVVTPALFSVIPNAVRNLKSLRTRFIASLEMMEINLICEIVSCSVLIQDATIRKFAGRKQTLPETDMTTIIGIDFSGARSDRNTWVAQGRLTSDSALIFDEAEMTPRKKVLNLLATASTPAVAGIDFPFGVPQAFAGFLCAGDVIESMPEVWRVLASMSQDEFVAARDVFVERFGEAKRAGDNQHFPESFSPLHKANPNMLPMTYYGVKMLRKLHERHKGRWIVPPLNSPDETSGKTVTLLESMPGAFLKAIGFEFSVFKRYKKARVALGNRRRILDELADRSGIALSNLSMLREDCLASDDCLDAVIAAVAAASWAKNPSRFRHPSCNELAMAKLEGWIYVSKPQSAE